MAPKRTGGGSPYAEVREEDWPKVTKKLIESHPLKNELVEVCLLAWSDIFATRIGEKGFRIGTDIELSPQIMGSFLHELIPLVFQDRYPGVWCRERNKQDKDLVSLTSEHLSIEIKTSSHASQIFGNRSYAQPPAGPTDTGRKGKSGYYLAINFEKFTKGRLPSLVQVRFGWLDHSDWIAQAAATGQQARVSPAAYAKKMVLLHSK